MFLRSDYVRVFKSVPENVNVAYCSPLPNAVNLLTSDIGRSLTMKYYQILNQQ